MIAKDINFWGPDTARIIAREDEYTAHLAEQEAADMAGIYAAILSPRYIHEYPNS